MIHPSYSQNWWFSSWEGGVINMGCQSNPSYTSAPPTLQSCMSSAWSTDERKPTFYRKQTVLHVTQFLQWKMTIIEKCVYGCTRQGGWFGDEQLIITRSFCIVNSCTLPKSSTKHTHTENQWRSQLVRNIVTTLTVKWPNGLRISFRLTEKSWHHSIFTLPSLSASSPHTCVTLPVFLSTENTA